MTSHSSGEVVPRGFDYAPAPESRGIVSIRDTYGLFVAGQAIGIALIGLGLVWRRP